MFDGLKALIDPSLPKASDIERYIIRFNSNINNNELFIHSLLVIMVMS